MLCTVRSNADIRPRATVHPGVAATGTDARDDVDEARQLMKLHSDAHVHGQRTDAKHT